MLALLDRVACETPAEFDYEWLGKFVRSIDVPVLDYKAHLPAPGEPGKYTRNILTLEPFEVVLLHWPAGVESAVHLHKGFWGYVLCLEGQIDPAGEYADNNRNALRFLAISHYNDALQLTKTFMGANAELPEGEWERFQSLMIYVEPGYDFGANAADFFKHMGRGYNRIYLEGGGEDRSR